MERGYTEGRPTRSNHPQSSQHELEEIRDIHSGLTLAEERALFADSVDPGSPRAPASSVLRPILRTEDSSRFNTMTGTFKASSSYSKPSHKLHETLSTQYWLEQYLLAGGQEESSLSLRYSTQTEESIFDVYNQTPQTPLSAKSGASCEWSERTRDPLEGVPREVVHRDPTPSSSRANPPLSAPRQSLLNRAEELGSTVSTQQTATARKRRRSPIDSFNEPRNVDVPFPKEGVLESYRMSFMSSQSDRGNCQELLDRELKLESCLRERVMSHSQQPPRMEVKPIVNDVKTRRRGRRCRRRKRSRKHEVDNIESTVKKPHVPSSPGSLIQHGGESSTKVAAIIQSRDQGERPVRLFGLKFGNLRPLPKDPKLDVPDYHCFNCWKRGHSHYTCPSPQFRPYCYNCGRLYVNLNDCPRCSDQHREFLKEEKNIAARERSNEVNRTREEKRNRQDGRDQPEHDRKREQSPSIRRGHFNFTPSTNRAVVSPQSRSPVTSVDMKHSSPKIQKMYKSTYLTPIVSPKNEPAEQRESTPRGPSEVMRVLEQVRGLPTDLREIILRKIFKIPKQSHSEESPNKSSRQ